MAGGAGKRGAIYGINITPLVDVTLVLLIIFIVTAKVVVTPAVPASSGTEGGTTTTEVLKYSRLQQESNAGPFLKSPPYKNLYWNPPPHAGSPKKR